MSRRPVWVTEARIVSASNGRSVRRSTTSASMLWSRLRTSAARRLSWTPFIAVTIVRSRPRRANAASPIRTAPADAAPLRE
jgi:hypothetical protein